MRKILFLAGICLTGLGFSSQAQYYFYNDKFYESDIVFELGGSFGGMNCLTDLGGKKGRGKGFTKDMNWKNTRLSGGFYVAMNYRDVLALRLEGTFGGVKAYDSILKKVKSSTTGRYERNLSFRSNIFEGAALVELHPLSLFHSKDPDYVPPRYSPYIVGGIGFFSFNPQARLNGVWVDLHPLRTEGQGFPEYPNKKEYSLRQVNIPMGMGVRYELSPYLTTRFEVLYRKLSTDYLDDVSTTYADATVFFNRLNANQAALASQLHDRRAELDPTVFPTPGQQRGDASDNDAFFTFQLKLGLTIGRQRVR